MKYRIKIEGKLLQTDGSRLFRAWSRYSKAIDWLKSNGNNVKKVMKLFGIVDEKHFRKELKKLGYGLPIINNFEVVTKDIMNICIKKHLRGESINSAAKEFNVSPQCLTNKMRQNNYSPLRRKFIKERDVESEVSKPEWWSKILYSPMLSYVNNDKSSLATN